MDLKLLKDTLRHYNFVLDKCRDDKLFTIGRIKQFRGEIRQLKTEIDIIERWQKLSSVPQANELLPLVTNRTCSNCHHCVVNPSCENEHDQYKCFAREHITTISNINNHVCDKWTENSF